MRHGVLKNSRMILSFLILIVFFSDGYAASMEKIRHWFLLASAGDVRLYKKGEKARKKLARCGEKAVPFLISQLGRKNIRKVREAERALRAIGDDAVPYLIMALADTNKGIASLSARILGSTHNRDAVPPLMVAARYGYPGLRASACYALGKLGDTAAVPILIDALTDTIASVRRLAALSLGRLKDERAIEPLFSLLSDSSYAVRYTAQNAISKIDSKKALEIALAKVDSAEIPEKYHLIVLLGALKDEDALPTLEKFLQDTSPQIRGFACEALGYFRGNWRVANMLKHSLWDNSPFVKMKAENSLDRLKKKSA